MFVITTTAFGLSLPNGERDNLTNHIVTTNYIVVTNFSPSEQRLLEISHANLDRKMNLIAVFTSIMLAFFFAGIGSNLYLSKDDRKILKQVKQTAQEHAAEITNIKSGLGELKKLDYSDFEKAVPLQKEKLDKLLEKVRILDILDIKLSADDYFYAGLAFVSKMHRDNAGNIGFNLNDLNQAIKYLTKAIELKPNLAEAYYNRGNAYSYKRKFKEAMNDFTNAIKLKPKFAMAYFNRGNVYNDLAKIEKDNKEEYLEKAQADFAKAEELRE
jgi:tetratricopeptide (TPR) repeat protein